MPKPVSGKEKKQMLQEAKKRKAQRFADGKEEENPASNEPRQDPANFFLKFVNDSDRTVEEHRALADQPFNFQEPHYKIDQTVYLREENCPALPLRPKHARNMNPEQYKAAEDRVFKEYFEAISPDLQTIATQFCQFELNRNVYREVWRVTERSDVMCVITDARFPLAHVPVSFVNYVRANGKPLILLINKIDLVSRTQVEQQEAFFQHYFERRQLNSVVISYSALRVTESPKERISLLQKVVQAARRLSGLPAPQQITIGFCGQPSVGKSRTMNGLVGKQVTKVRLTAGCTKHLQTYYLDLEAQPEAASDEEEDDRKAHGKVAKKTAKKDKGAPNPFPGETKRSVLLCDCPGLVLPVKNAPRPLQIVTGVFPTGRVREFYSSIRLLVESSPQFLEQIRNLIDFQLIKARHHLKDDQLDTNSPEALLACLAYQLNYLTKGASPWTHKAGLWLMKKLTEGTFVYEVPLSDAAAQALKFEDKWTNATRGAVLVDDKHLREEIARIGATAEPLLNENENNEEEQEEQ